MLKPVQSHVDEFMSKIIARNPNEPEFLQAVQEVAGSIIPFIEDKPEYREARILERLTEPDRIISFRVCWEDDHPGRQGSVAGVLRRPGDEGQPGTGRCRSGQGPRAGRSRGGVTPLG